MTHPDPIQEITHFDPFQSRLCRDVRNDLSESLMEAISSQNIGPALAIAEKYTFQGISAVVKKYLADRMERYEIVIKQIKAANFKMDDTFAIALLLWDKGVFFEVHEWLENKWLKSEGREKMVLQALIRAAGTYEHLRYGRQTGARKMAAKAVESLHEHEEGIPDFFNAPLLMRHLEKLDPVPPKLGADELVQKQLDSL